MAQRKHKNPMQVIYNTLGRQKQALSTIEPGKVRMYVCGPTVYDFFHIGNARTFTTFDMVYRWLSVIGFEVNYVRNITDIDDKIIERANANNESMETLTDRMTAAFFEDADRLKLLHPTHSPRATHHIEHMLAIIERLEDKGMAYRAANGDVYYAVREFAGYGKLSGKNPDDLRAGERVAVETAKRDPLDFVLWKAAKPAEPQWPSIFGGGRPGWHIECSAMCEAVLGEQIDIHGGGFDLQFPHHENEIAQTEGTFEKNSGKQFSRYWMHGAFLNWDQEKMSKSLGNFFTLREVLNKLDAVQGGETVRYLLLRGHYRSEINYSWEMLEDARQSLLGFYIALKETPPVPIKLDWTNAYAQKFRAAMEDDFDTPAAFTVLHELRREVNRGKSAELAGLLKALGATLGFFQDVPAAFVQGAAGTTELDVDSLVAARDLAKKAKDFAKADAIRRQLDAAGIALEDKPGGVTEWRRK
jgi:cysteinyl-tRNA synthetase